MDRFAFNILDAAPPVRHNPEDTYELFIIIIVVVLIIFTIIKIRKIKKAEEEKNKNKDS